mgnify:CR=1 FL=1|tara:strand:- start:21377 stop:23530 length:2154 start_codon:yes stop_codon:yes gene_type:complete
MGVEDNLFEINELETSDTFQSWFTKTNAEIIAKLNNLKIYDLELSNLSGLSGAVGTTAAGTGTAGKLELKLLHTIPHGLTLQGNATITGSLDASSIVGANSFILNGQVIDGVTTAFDFGTFVRMDASGLTKAKADSAANAEVLGMVTGTSDTSITIAHNGYVEGLYNPHMSTGGVFFLDPTVAGGFTATEPVLAGRVSKPVLVGASGNTGAVLLSMRGQLLQDTGTGNTGGYATHKIYVNVGSVDHHLVKGKVVAYNPNTLSFDDGRAQYNGFYLTKDDANIDDAIGIVTGEPAPDTIEITTSGLAESIPADYGKGKLYISGVTGELRVNPVVARKKLFAINYDTSNNNAIVVNNTSVPVTDLLTGSSPNILINGGFDVWQRYPTGATIEGVNNIYSADRWVRNLNATGATMSTATYIRRLEFDADQIEIKGNPQYYLRTFNVITGAVTGDHLHLENRIEDSRTLANETATVSGYIRSGSGKTVPIRVKQIWNGVTGSEHSGGTLSTSTSWGFFSSTFTVPGITGASANPEIAGDHYLALGFDLTDSSSTFHDFAQIKLEHGDRTTAFFPVNQDEELAKASRYYQRSYQVDESTGQVTKGAGVVDSHIVEFTYTPYRETSFRYPVPMRSTPLIKIYSPDSGNQDAFNAPALRDLRNTSGTLAFDGTPRVCEAGVTAITSVQTSRIATRFKIIAGAHKFDTIQLHYVADADFNNNVTT